MIVQDYTDSQINPLLELGLELINLRFLGEWKEASIVASYGCGMMLTALSFKMKDGLKNIPVEIPTEYCQQILKFRDRFNESTNNNVNKIQLSVSSNGAYKLEME